MGEQIECPSCGHRFYVHGYEEFEKCYRCDNMFNPQRNMLDNMGQKVYVRGN